MAVFLPYAESRLLYYGPLKGPFDILDLLSHLVRIWEDEHVEIPPLSGIELIKELCRERGTSQRALVPIFGTPSIVSEVFSGKRELQRKHIEALAAFFHVSPED